MTYTMTYDEAVTIERAMLDIYAEADHEEQAATNAWHASWEAGDWEEYRDPATIDWREVAEAEAAMVAARARREALAPVLESAQAAVYQRLS